MDGCIGQSAISPLIDSQKGKIDGGGVMLGGKGPCVVSMARITTTNEVVG